jgi:peroxiredoxin
MPNGMFVLAARLLLAAVFIVAGWAKLADATGTRRSMADFGVPAALAPAFALLVPCAEIASALALVTVGLAWWGSMGAAALLIAFTGGVAINLLLGRKPDCRCFGQVHSSRIGWPSVVRNAVLFGLAAFIAAQGPAGSGPGVTTAWNAARARGLVIPTWVLVLIGAWVLAAVWLYWSLPDLEPDTGHPAPKPGPVPAAAPEPARPTNQWGLGLPLDTPAPAFTLNSLGGDVVTLDSLRESGKPILLVFTRPNCPSCDGVLPDVALWQREHAGRLLVMPISKSGFEANREKVAKYGLLDVLVQNDNEVADAYGVEMVPGALLVVDGRIASPVAEGRDAIRALVAEAVEERRI